MSTLNEIEREKSMRGGSWFSSLKVVNSSKRDHGRLKEDAINLGLRPVCRGASCAKRPSEE
jgi:hypothetical protein